MNFFKYRHSHIRLHVPWQFDVPLCSLPVVVHIAQVFSESFSEASFGLADVLLLAVGDTAGAGIPQVSRVAVHLRGELLGVV